MAHALPDVVRQLVAGRNYVHLATVMPDGSPHSVAVWVDLEGDRALIGTVESSQKARNARREPRVAFSVVDRENPYRIAQVRGRVVEYRTGTAGEEAFDRISRKYTGQDFPFRPPDRVVLVIEPEKATHMVLPFHD